MNTYNRKILEIVAHDIENVLMPSISSPNVKFIASTMKTLLQRVAYSLPDFINTESGAKFSGEKDWEALIGWAEADETTALAGKETSRESAWNQSGSGVAEADGTTTVRTRPIEPELLLSYLKRRPGFEWVNALTVDQAAGGFSKDTFLVRMRGSGRTDRMVLRRDQVFRPLVSSVADEENVLQTLSAAGFPVPAPLWLEEAPEHFGVSVLATTWVDGSADSSHWANDPEKAKKVIADAARLLARLHAFPIDVLKTRSSNVPGSIGATPAEFASHLRGFWRTVRPEANPLMERVLDWLDSNAPAEFLRPVIVHSDFGFHNLLVNEEGRIAGLLDWEFWHIGDAREDLAYCRFFVERLNRWAEFREIYEAEGGVVSDPGAEHFYSVLGGARIAMACYAIQHELKESPDRLDSKMIYVGQSFAHRFLIAAAKTAADSDKHRKSRDS